MTANAAHHEQTAERDHALNDESLLTTVQSLWHELGELFHDRILLAALETRRAGESLVVMLVAAVLIAVLLNGAWLGLVVAAVFWLVEQGMVTSRAILLAVVFHLLIILMLVRVIRRNSRYLQFPATLRSLSSTRQ
jgi:uncharacterized membrane protein YqjE